MINVCMIGWVSDKCTAATFKDTFFIPVLIDNRDCLEILEERKYC